MENSSSKNTIIQTPNHTTELKHSIAKGRKLFVRDANNALHTFIADSIIADYFLTGQILRVQIINHRNSNYQFFVKPVLYYDEE